MIDTIEWWHAPPPWTCDGCAEPFSDLGHVDLSALDDSDESGRLCASCWPRATAWAHRDRLVTEATGAAADDDADTITLTHWSGETVTEPFYGPVQQLRTDLDRLEDSFSVAADHEEDDDEGGDDGDQQGR
jgi:hypothetical protein